MAIHDKYKFIDFCSGIGSAHLALTNLGAESVGYSEINLKSEATYKLLHGNSNKNYGDLMAIDSDNLPDFDLLVAGFPCQAFSIVGKRQAFNDERGQIIYGLSKIISNKKPKAFLLENVKGLVNINNGRTIKEIIALLNRSGYHISYKILESVDFDIPQKRERVYFVGIRNDLFKGEFSFPQAMKPSKKLEDFLIEDDDAYILRGNLHQTFLKFLNNKYNQDKFTLTELLKKNYLVIDTRQSDLRLYHGAIPTLRTGRQGILYIKNGEIRRLSGREGLLLQGFDSTMARMAQDNFTQTAILAQAGNAMTVSVMQAIGREILEYLS